MISENPLGGGASPELSVRLSCDRESGVSMRVGLQAASTRRHDAAVAFAAHCATKPPARTGTPTLPPSCSLVFARDGLTRRKALREWTARGGREARPGWRLLHDRRRRDARGRLDSSAPCEARRERQIIESFEHLMAGRDATRDGGRARWSPELTIAAGTRQRSHQRGRTSVAPSSQDRGVSQRAGGRALSGWT
jgi:hypothetical protein